MGCGESRQSTPFREKDDEVSWHVTNAQWKTFVETTYTEEYIEESGAQVDCYSLWKDMNQLEVNGRYVVGRSCHMGKDFVSFGRILVDKPYWHSYEGTYTCDDMFFGAGRKEDYQIEKLKDGSLVCKATGQATSQDQISGDTGSVAFQGQGRKLFDDDDDKPKGQKLGDDDGPAETAEVKQDANPDRLVWRQLKDGTVEVYIKSTQAWAPAQLEYTGFEEITVVHDGKQVGTFKRDITKIPLENRKFDGSDMVFGRITKESDVSNTKEAKWMSLHAVICNEQKKLLQVVCTLGRSGRGQPRSLTCPIPVNKLSTVKQVVSTYRQWIKPMWYQGRYLSEKEVRDMMITWMVVDIAVTLCCFALMSAMMADSAMYAGDAAFGEVAAGEGGAIGFGLLDFF